MQTANRSSPELLAMLDSTSSSHRPLLLDTATLPHDVDPPASFSSEPSAYKTAEPTLSCTYGSNSLTKTRQASRPAAAHRCRLSIHHRAY